MSSFSGVMFVCFALLCFFFRHAFVEAAALRSIVLRYASAPIATRVYFYFFGNIAFSEYFFVPFPIPLCMESTPYVLSFRMVFLYFVTTGWIFYIILTVRIQSIKSIIIIIRNNKSLNTPSLRTMTYLFLH